LRKTRSVLAHFNVLGTELKKGHGARCDRTRGSCCETRFVAVARPRGEPAGDQRLAQEKRPERRDHVVRQEGGARFQPQSANGRQRECGGDGLPGDNGATRLR